MKPEILLVPKRNKSAQKRALKLLKNPKGKNVYKYKTLSIK